MVMRLSKKEAAEINANLDTLKKRVQELESENIDLNKKIALKDAKIKDQMEGLQHLNRDLDMWEPLADVVARIPLDTDKPITVPAKALILITNAYA